MEENDLKHAEEMVFQRKHVRGMSKAIVKAMKDYVESNDLSKLETKRAITLFVSSSLAVQNELLQIAAECGITKFILKTTEDVDRAQEIIDLEKQFYKEIKDGDDDVHA